MAERPLRTAEFILVHAPRRLETQREKIDKGVAAYCNQFLRMY